MSAPSRLETLQQLTQQLRRFERVHAPLHPQPSTLNAQLRSTGIPPLDDLLPDRGLRDGTLSEWLAPGPGSGAGTLAFAAAAGLLQTGGTCLVVDAARTFYPPAVSSRIDLRQMVVVHPANARDELWALEQSLRCRGVTATIGWPERIDNRAYRRLQLAAETGGGCGFLLRPAKFRSEPSWADLRLLVEPVGLGVRRPSEAVASLDGLGRPSYEESRRLRVHLLHCRGGMSGGTVELEIDDETGDVRAAAPLAAAAAATRTTGT
jgi:protein ImuA